MKKLRILHVTFDMAIGGTEQVIRQLVLNLPTDEFDNEIFCIDGKIGAVGAQLQQQGIRIHQAARKAGLDFDLIKTLRQTLRSGDFDVVHCHQYTPWVYGWFAAWGCKAKVVFTEHGRFFPDRSRGKALPLNVLMALTTSAITAISSATRDALARYEWVPKPLVQVIYNGIQPLKYEESKVAELRRQLGLSDDLFIVGTVARLDPVKNQAMMLRAFALVQTEYPNTRLLVVGDGPSRQELEQLTLELGLRELVIFTGFTNEAALYMQLMDIYLLSSFTEGTSMTLLEAMSLSKPCVVTAVGGNPEIIDNEVCGYVVPSDQPEFFSTAIRKLLADKCERVALGAKGYDRFNRKFSVARMIESFSGLYKKF
jgi:glycosyltransferase involved in cell wall biosynthesis